MPDPLIGPMDVADWSGWELLIADRGIVIERGHIPGTSAADGEEVDVIVGTMRTGLVGLIALTHQPSEVIEPKLMMNLSRVDANGILAFLDRCDRPPGLDLVWRSGR